MTHLLNIAVTIIAGAGLSVPAFAMQDVAGQDALGDAVGGVAKADEQGDEQAESAPANAKKMPASTPEQLVASIKSCSTAVSAEGIKDDNLAKAGWSKGELKSPDGEATDAVRVYSHKEVGALIMLPPEARKDGKSCIVMAKMGSVKDVASAANLLSTEMGQAPEKGRTQDIVWLAGGRAIQLTTSGEEAQPAVRVIVAYAQTAQTKGKIKGR